MQRTQLHLAFGFTDQSPNRTIAQQSRNAHRGTPTKRRSSKGKGRERLETLSEPPEAAMPRPKAS
eukprot:3554438-Prymnesium_polylepis.1